MEKIDPKKAVELSKKLNRFSYGSNPFYIASNCLSEIRNGEEIIFEVDEVDDKLKPLFLPEKKENIENQPISWAYDSDIEKLKREGFEIKKKVLYDHEYVFKTQEFIDMKGKEFKEFRKSVNVFAKNYKFKVLNDYPRKKIVEFLESWKKQKNIEGKSADTIKSLNIEFELDMKWFDLTDKIPCYKLFLEIDGKLAGFAVFLALRDNLWVALMQKVDYKYKGITRFLYHEKAKIMKNIEFFTTGTAGRDPKLREFKESLNPAMKLPVYVLEIGRKAK